MPAVSAWIRSTVDHPLQGLHVSCEDHLMDGLGDFHGFSPAFGRKNAR